MLGKRILRTIYFTENGNRLAMKLKDNNPYFILEIRAREDDLDGFVRESFEAHLPLIFIGAVGIAVRFIAKYIDNKLCDSPVIVIDELGHYVIPILSGHFGGANEIARQIADSIDSNACITTASDINGTFAVDVYAREMGYRIDDKNSIKIISKAYLEGRIVKKSILNDSIEFSCQEGKLRLFPKKLVLGMGCKKDKSFKELLSFVLDSFDLEYLRDNLYAIASIDIKGNEVGLIKLAQFLGCKFLVFSSDELSSIKGDFPSSDFVKETAGVSNVCERAAVLGAGLTKRDLILEKIAKDGMTLAAANRVIDRKVLEA